jgi:hypothetical protein
MPRSDRLRLLAGCHGVLRHQGIDSLAAYRSASREHLARLHKFGPTIRRLVDRGDPDVLSALRPPRDITWMVAMVTGSPTTRLLSVKRGPLGQAGGELLSLTYTDSVPGWRG